MNKKNIILINPFAPIKTSNRISVGVQYGEALSIQYLAAALEENDYHTEIFSGLLNEKNIIALIDKYKPVAIGFCVYTSTFNTSLHHAKIAKNRAKSLGYDLFTILGGYHATVLAEEILINNSIDFVVKGEADKTICNLINAIEHKTDLSDVRGISFKKNNKIFSTKPQERITELDSLPNPIRIPALIHLPKKDVTNLSYPPYSHPGNLALMIYGRGCPFACSFCTSKDIWGGEIYWRSPQKVVDEMEKLHDKFNVNSIGFLDLTFNASKKKVLELCDELIKRDIPVYFAAMARMDRFDEEMLEALAKAKGIKFSVGIESLHMPEAKIIKDQYFAKKEQIQKILNKTTDLGILIRAFLIIGFPSETKAMIENYSKELEDYSFDELRITIATPFPGTALWDECQTKNLLPEDLNWDDFTTETPIINHPSLKNSEILEMKSKLITDFYFGPYYFCHIKNKIQKSPELKQSFVDYFSYYYQNNYFPEKKSELEKLIINIKNL